MSNTTKYREHAATFKAQRSVKDVARFLEKKLRHESLERFGLDVCLATWWKGSADYDFSAIDSWESVRRRFRHVACYAVTGSNEGHYIYIALSCEMCNANGKLLPDRERKPNKVVTVFSGKTFGGLAVAFEIARRCAVLLDA